MPAAGTLSVKCMDSSTFEGCDGVLYKTTLVESVCVDEYLNIHVVGDGEAAIDGGWRRTPVFMKLKAACPSFDLLNKARRQACVAFTEETEIHWKRIGSL